MASMATTAENLKRMYEECEKIVAEQRAKRNICPYVCPSYPETELQKKVYKESGIDRHEPGPYVPGEIRPPKPREYPADAPPLYLPQPTDTTNGDFLTMGPIDPWAAGHMDWSSHAGITGVRPVVEKYSITRYCLNDWRKHNEFVLKANTVQKGKILNEDCHRQIAKTYEDIEEKAKHSNNMLKKRIDELKEWKKKVEISQKGIEDELEALEVDRMRLKGASRILMLPETIAKECLELRTHRLEPDLVRDDAEQELIREVAIVGEIRKVFSDTLMKVEKQLLEDRAAKAAIDLDWSDKVTALKEDKKNASMDQSSSIILCHAGVSRWPENATSLAYWKHFCSENIKNTDEVRQRSEKLRSDLMTAIIKGGQDLKTQHDRTNMALAFTVKVTEDLCEKLEETLKDCLQKIADVENLLDYLRDSLRDLAKRDKLAMTRLKSRNYARPNVENCRDEAQYALMDEIKFVHESIDNLKDRMRQADMVRAELMKNRGDLEKEIACKRKSLNIDRDRMTMIREHMPSPEEFASAVCMVAGVAVYPAGWSETSVQETCGPTADQYNIGRCHVRWAYLLAIIGCLDGIVLAALAFILATRHVRLQPDSGYPPPSLYKGEVNNAYMTDAASMSGSRKSLSLQPVLIMRPHAHAPLAPLDLDSYSHYSGRTARPKHGLYANTMHNNYQL